MSKKLRLLKVLVEPIFVYDDGINLQEIRHQPVEVSAKDWPTYSNERFPKELDAWQNQLDQEINQLD